MLQGNCTEPVPAVLAKGLYGPPLLPLKPRQCLIVTSHSLVQSWLPEPAGAMWLDNLYIRIGDRFTPPTFQPEITVVSSGQLYLTRVTIQGNGEARVRAIDSQYANSPGARKSLFTSGEGSLCFKGSCSCANPCSLSSSSFFVDLPVRLTFGPVY
jgi:hypothetical protein